MGHRFEMRVSGEETEEEAEERWAVQAFAERLGEYLTLASIEPGKTFGVYDKGAAPERVVVEYTVR